MTWLAFELWALIFATKAREGDTKRMILCFFYVALEELTYVYALTLPHAHMLSFTHVYINGRQIQEEDWASVNVRSRA